MLFRSGGKSDINSMIGNAVPVNLAKFVGAALMRYIMGICLLLKTACFVVVKAKTQPIERAATLS